MNTHNDSAPDQAAGGPAAPRRHDADGYDPERFMDALSKWMQVAGIRDHAELCRRAGIRQSLVNRWSKGAQPSNENIRKLAPVLEIPVTNLLTAAGHFRPDELDDGDDVLSLILGSDKLTDRQKIEIIREWRRWEAARRRFTTRIGRMLYSGYDSLPDDASIDRPKGRP